MNDYESHLSSYDHTHKQRLKDMKAMVRDPNAGARVRKAEAKADGLISIKLPDKDKDPSASAKKPGFKRSGFKSAFAPKEPQPSIGEAKLAVEAEAAPVAPAKVDKPSDESSTDDDGYERYNPRYPTD